MDCAHDDEATSHTHRGSPGNTEGYLSANNIIPYKKTSPRPSTNLESCPSPAFITYRKIQQFDLEYDVFQEPRYYDNQNSLNFILQFSSSYSRYLE